MKVAICMTLLVLVASAGAQNTPFAAAPKAVIDDALAAAKAALPASLAQSPVYAAELSGAPSLYLDTLEASYAYGKLITQELAAAGPAGQGLAPAINQLLSNIKTPNSTAAAGGRKMLGLPK